MEAQARQRAIRFLVSCWFVTLLVSCSPWLTSCKRARTVASPPDTPRTGVAALKKEPRIRILLKEGFTTCRVEGDSRAPVLQVERRGGALRLLASGSGAAEGILGEGTGFRLSPADQYLVFEGHAYRGVIDVFLNPLGQAVVVNDLPMEDYLCSVVPREMGPYTYPELEALKAQSVAARTYAVSLLGRNAEKGFDVYQDSRSQAYSGADSEHPLSGRAVAETDGIVATYLGSPIVSLYCSTCGGITEDYQLIFKGGPIAYLRGGASCSDQTSPYHDWEEWIDLRERDRELSRYAEIGRLQKLEVLQKSQAGRVVAMRFSGDRGEAVLRGNDLRFALGLRSNWIVSIRESRDLEGYLERIRVRGKGWGHGVGLCQVGAFEMAREGSSHEQILSHYYPGVSLSRWY